MEQVSRRQFIGKSFRTTAGVALGAAAMNLTAGRVRGANEHSPILRARTEQVSMPTDLRDLCERCTEALARRRNMNLSVIAKDDPTATLLAFVVAL